MSCRLFSENQNVFRESQELYLYTCRRNGVFVYGRLRVRGLLTNTEQKSISRTDTVYTIVDISYTSSGRVPYRAAFICRSVLCSGPW